MTSQRQKFQKKKDRERSVRKKVLRRREAIRTEAKEKREEELRLETEHQLRNGKQEPILTDPVKIARREAQKAAMVEERLKKNLQILEALEAEYEQEHQQREDANKLLEGEGHKSIKEKMQALYAKTLKFKESVEETRKDIEAELTDKPSPVENITQGLRDIANKCGHDCECLQETKASMERRLMSKEGEEIVRDELGCTSKENTQV